MQLLESNAIKIELEVSGKNGIKTCLYAGLEQLCRWVSLE